MRNLEPTTQYCVEPLYCKYTGAVISIMKTLLLN